MAAFLSCFIFATKILNLLSGNLENGIFTPFNNNHFGSAMILPLVKSTFLLISDEKQESILKGESVQLIYL